jgi:anti-anti-sigma regulatory factor
MAGNTANAAVWGEADVLIAPIGTAIPTTNAAFAAEWDYVGLLDGGQGFEESIEVESTDHDAWGYGTILTTYKAQKLTKTFTALEENETVMNLVYDASGVTFTDGVGYVGTLKVRDHTEQVLIAFVTRSGDNERRMISKGYATVAPTAAGTESEESLGSKSFEATIFPNGSQELWYAYKGASL